jgi:hypothetical protein
MNPIHLKRHVAEHSQKLNPHLIYRAHLAEDYDGIGQWTLVFLSNGSTSTAYKAKVAAGDFATGQMIPERTPVTIFVNHGQVEILSLGYKI